MFLAQPSLAPQGGMLGKMVSYRMGGMAEVAFQYLSGCMVNGSRYENEYHNCALINDLTVLYILSLKSCNGGDVYMQM